MKSKEQELAEAILSIGAQRAGGIGMTTDKARELTAQHVDSTGKRIRDLIAQETAALREEFDMKKFELAAADAENKKQAEQIEEQGRLIEKMGKTFTDYTTRIDAYVEWNNYKKKYGKQ